MKKLLFGLLFMVMCVSAYPAIVIEDSAIGGATGTTSTISVTVSGTNTVIYAIVMDETSGMNITGVTYNGDALTKEIGNNAWGPHVSIWYLVAPDDGTHDLVVSHGSQSLIVGGLALSGAAQQGPEASEEEYTSSSTSSSTDITTVTANALIIGGTTSSTNSGSFIAVSGQTLQGQQNAPGGSSFESSFATKVTTTAGANTYGSDKDTTSSNLISATVSVAEVQTAGETWTPKTIMF